MSCITVRPCCYVVLCGTKTFVEWIKGVHFCWFFVVVQKYASAFEKEKIGLVELPYMSEERMHKLGIPMGPRLRIMQEAQLGFPGMHENTLAIV